MDRRGIWDGRRPCALALAAVLAAVLGAAVWASVTEAETAMVDQAKLFQASEAAEEAERASSRVAAVREFIAHAAEAASTPSVQLRIAQGDREGVLKTLVDLAPSNAVTRISVIHDQEPTRVSYPADVEIVEPMTGVRRAPDGTDAWFVVSQPIRRATGEQYATLHAEVSLTRLLPGIPTHGKSGVITLAERDGTVLLTGNAERRGRTFGARPVALIGEGRPGVARYHSPLTNSSQIAAVQPIEGTPWSILVSTETGVALQQANDLSVRLGFILVAAVLATVVVIATAVWLMTHAGRNLNAERQAAEMLALTDPLTGVGNRLTFRRAVDALADGTAGVVVVDLDRFKEINDNFGHDTGDIALQHVAQALCNASRPHDVVARMGGDEFAVLIADANDDIVRRTAERLRSALTDTTIPGHGPITASIGTAIAHSHEHVSDVLRRADADMYRDKQQRRLPTHEHPALTIATEGC